MVFNLKLYNFVSAEGTECVDKDPKLNGGMTCYEFLDRYGYQYCGSPSFIQNCCAAQKYLCDKQAVTTR